MFRSSVRRIALAAMLPLLVAGTASAQYDYGGRSAYDTTSDGHGVIFILETGYTNPRNADNVVASSSAAVIIPDWEDDLSGRIGVGYEWDGGQKVVASFWGFDTEVSSSGSGAFEFPVGPTPGTTYSDMTEIMARLADVSAGVDYEPTRKLNVEWSVGLRYAAFEETKRAVYSGATAAFKSNEGTMIGVRLAGHLSYRFAERLSIDAGLGYSFLDGELEANSTVGAASTRLTDDGRSGTILDFEVTGSWHNSTNNVRILLGWEQSIWEDIATDLLRVLPSASFPLRERDAVTFSGFKAGVHFQF